MDDHGPPDKELGLNDLLRALAQVGRIAEAMLAQQDALAGAPVPAVEPARRDTEAVSREQDLPHSHQSENEDDPDTSRPGTWRDSVPPAPRQFFTKHAAERLHERYGVSYSSMVQTMAALSHQIRGTHLLGLEAVNLGQRAPSDGVPGTVWAVEIFRQVGFVVTGDDDIIVTALPRDAKQLQSLNGPQRAALEAFRTELHLRHTGPVFLNKYQGRR